VLGVCLGFVADSLGPHHGRTDEHENGHGEKPLAVKVASLNHRRWPDEWPCQAAT
jgi:hypothetical protein